VYPSICSHNISKGVSRRNWNGNEDRLSKADVAIPVMLKQLRENSKLTQSDVARVLGISYQAYQRLEKPGKSNPTVKTLERLARVFHKNLHLELT
jgi:DNA-binding XRE family transcriptional regulator